MKKKVLFSLSILSVFALVVFVATKKEEVTKASYNELVKNHPIQERLKLSKKERKRKGIPPNRYFDEQYLLEMDPATGKTYPKNLIAIKEQLKARKARFSRVPGESTSMAWEERGPNNIGGRTRVVFYDPNDATGKRVFAGGVSGGLWVNNDIADESSTWSQVGIDENLSISCFTIDPNNSNIWYVGTGEAYTQDDGTGNGIWVTKNGGRTWEALVAVDLEENLQNRKYFVTQILAWNNNGTTELFYSIDGSLDIDFVGTQAIGWFQYENGASSRIDFLNNNESPYVFSDVEVAADNAIWVATKTNIFGHGGGKIFRSTDGVNFTEKYSFSNAERVELAVSKQNPNKVFALAAENNSSLVTLVKTENGNSFNAMARPNDLDSSIGPNDFAREQGFYNLMLEVDTEDDSILYAGGINLFQSSNAGNSWEQISKWTNNFGLDVLDVSLVHADHHAMAFNPNNSKQAIFAHDGGISYSDNLATVASNTNAIVTRNKNYNITQFYSADISQNTSTDLFLGGTQDNGSLLSFIPISENRIGLGAKEGTNTFLDIFGGDGIQNFIDKDGKYLIVSFVNNVYSSYPFPLTDPEEQIVEIANDQASGSFANIADLDDNLDILYTDGSTGYQTENISPQISRFSRLLDFPERKNFSNSLLLEAPTAIKVSPFTTNSSTVFIGTQGASILKVTNLNTDNPTWQDIDLNGVINVGSISAIDFGENENEILVTLHNYGVKNIYYTNNGGAAWFSKEGDFPDIPVKTIKMNPLRRNEVIVGTNMGIWKTSNFNSEFPTWTQSINGMSSVRVTDLEIRTEDNTVLAATYGRGLFTGKFTSDASTNEKGNELVDKVTFTNSGTVSSVLEFTLKDLIQGEFFIVQMFDTSGKLVLNEEITYNTADTYRVDAPVTYGVYIVKIATSTASISKKVIIGS